MNEQADTIEVLVFTHEQYNGPDELFPFNTTLNIMIARLEGFKQLIPAEYVEQAHCEISSVASYEDTYYTKIVVSYRRPMTEEEKAKRDARQAKIDEFALKRAREALVKAETKMQKWKGTDK